MHECIDVQGIRCRLSLNLDDERVVVREFSYPRGLSEKKYPWKN